jgi:hypothetical protein
MKNLLLILAVISVMDVAICSATMATQLTNQTATSQHEVTAKVTDIDGETLTAEDESGNTYLFKAASSETLKKLNVGDIVKLVIEMEHTTSIRKIEGKYDS